MALNITPPVGHLAANFAGLPQQIGLLGAGDIPTTGLLGPFTPMNLPDYTGDLPTSGFDVTSYVEKYKADQKKKKGGGNGNGNGGAERGGETEAYGLATFGPESEWAGNEMYGAYSGQLSHAQLANKYGAGGVGALFGSNKNNAFVEMVGNALVSAGIGKNHKDPTTGKSTGKYSAEDFAAGQAMGIFDDDDG